MALDATTPRTIAMGCMRLSTVPDRDDERGIAVLHAAFDAGVTLLDTADAYCLDHSDIGHNERLIARARDSWPGDRSHVRIATKGGLTRPDGRWAADGRARHLTSACPASRLALGVARIDLYQLHAPDPRIPLATSVRALHALKRDGLVEAIGLCNVTVGQIEEARQITEIASVQVELSVWQDAAVLGGVLEYCEANGIALLAYRPFGGPDRNRRVVSDPLLLALADDRGVTPFEIALAALIDLSPVVCPLPGPTRLETAGSIGRAHAVVFTEDERDRLAERFPACRAARARKAPSPAVDSRPGDREIVIVMGLPGAGKSTLAQSLVAEGYMRLNRDETGGSLNGLLPALDRAILSGSSRIVLDNTYVSRKARGAVIQAARDRGIPVRCVWMSTTVEDSQINAVSRIVSRYGTLLGPDEMRAASRTDVAAFGPTVQFRYQRELEPPDPSEGFASVEMVPFERRRDPSFVNQAVIVWVDGILHRSRSMRRTPTSPEDVEAFVERGAVLRRYEAEGWKVLGVSWLPEIAESSMTAEDADAIHAELRRLLGIAIEIEYCPHGGGPPSCWCRKPLPGLGVVFQQRHQLDPARCLYVGSGPQDPGFARRLGLQYRDAAEFFGVSLAPQRGQRVDLGGAERG
jgi:aryl-alcohol dehydrogenase-like predicted oxidoreductase/predicted kinase/histidinol phosphatase-like enzyme